MQLETFTDSKGRLTYKGIKIDPKAKKEKLGEVKEGAWIGIADAWVMIEDLNTKIQDMHWWISIEVEKVSGTKPVRALKFDAVKLNKKVFEARKSGHYFRQSIYAHWLEDAVNGMISLDGKLQ